MIRHAVITREQVLAYRANVHDLVQAGSGATVLDVGLQDYPPGRTAQPALHLRTGASFSTDGTALVHAARGALHLHRSDDRELLAAALRHTDPGDLSPAVIGPFGAELVRAGIDLADAMDEIASAMSEVMSDGVARTKGELSGAVSGRIDRRLTPWCEGCGVHHVQDAVFRYATVQAGLVVDVESATPFRYRYTAISRRMSTDVARSVLVRRFLRAMGPAAPANLAAWLGITSTAAKRWWQLIAEDLVPVSLEGATRHVHHGDLDLLTSPLSLPPPRLLTAYDPLTELADRRWLVPDPTRRQQVWSPTANPGVVLIDGEISGTWRQRTARGQLTITVTPFRPLGDDQVDVLSRDAHVIAEHAGADRHSVVLAA